MDISIILCTFNRFATLRNALESAAAQILPESVRWEVLVVDNNSTDSTRQVAEEYCRKYPTSFRYIFELQQGKSNALNRGIREAQAQILAFLDDDVTAEPDWLQNLTAPLRQHSTWAGVGGRIAPPLNFSPPSWLLMDGPYEMAGILALFDKGRVPAELTEPPFGTNMAFRKQIFEKHGLFRPDLGPCPGSEIRGEDTEFGRRVLKAGERLWYEPSAIVHHGVPESRLRKEYFLRFLYDHGRASIREKSPQPPFGFIPRLYLTASKIILSALLRRTIAWLFTWNSAVRFQRKCMVWMNCGQIAEIFHLLSQGSANGSNPPAVIATGNENRA
jgi:GT2 family glycosyltransferase